MRFAHLTTTIILTSASAVLMLSPLAVAQSYTNPQVNGGTSPNSTGANAHQTAQNEQSNNHIMGDVSLAAGEATMAIACPIAAVNHFDGVAKYFCFAVGPGMIVGGIADLAMANKRQGAIDATNGTGGYGGATDGGGGQLPKFTPDEQAAIDTAKSFGVDPTNADSVAAAKDKAGDGGGSGGQGLDFAAVPGLKEAVDKAKDKAMSGYHVASVGTEGGAGGGARKGGGDLNMNDLLKGLMPGERTPASVDGLQKNIGGEPIGVAGDNIFKQVTRRYQAKIKANSFLGDLAPSKSSKLH